MKLNVFKRLQGEEWDRYKEEINKENRIAIHLLGMAGLPLTLVSAAAQCVTAGFNLALVCSLFMAAYFLLLMLTENFLLPVDYSRSTGLLYFLEAPAMLMSVLLGTVLDPKRQAITVLLFMVALPVFIMDKPIRMALISAVWVALFLTVSFFCKERSIWIMDAMHVFEFYITIVALMGVLLRIRMEVLKHSMKEKYRLEHEPNTDCQNRYALNARLEDYVGRYMTVVLANMDRFTLYNDFYGHELGQKIVDFFTTTLMNCFGAEDTYHYNGEEFLCVVHGGQEDCKEKIEQCRKVLSEYSIEDRALPLTCTFGSAVGTPGDVQEFQEMVQLANINSHKAQKTGTNADISTEYNVTNLRAAIAQSNVLTQVQESEIDQLTGLPGMSFFVNRSDALIGRGMVYKERNPVVGFFKLVQMRAFNDAFGYALGDALIAETARLLQENFPSRYICRITAAQFGILCYEAEAEAGINKVNEALQNFKPGFRVTGKAGFARYAEGESVISLLDRAHVAQKTLAPDSGTTFCYYDKSIDAEMHFNKYIISHVDEAVERGWLQVYYQPIARTVTRNICNEEALSRWNDPQYGFLTPNRFIPTLEEHGLMYKVNLHVVGQVLRDFQRRQDLGVPIVPVSVNLSRRDFEKCDMVQEITSLVDASGYPHSMLKIEITESAFIENQELLKREMARFRSNGFDVWMDDFGSEYSTLNLLEELDFDLIKIDMKFMKNFTASGKNYIIISDIIDMARRMGITTLIEGVETWDQFRILQSLGCEKMQGYLFNRPNPFDYIVDRAMRKVGLPFEEPEAAPYYEAIGRIDLSEPLAHPGNEVMENAQLESEIPAGVLELRDGRLTVLRSNTRFQELLEKIGAFVPVPDDSPGMKTLGSDPPEDFVAALNRSIEQEGWVNFTVDSKEAGYLDIYMRRVSSAQYRNGTAVLVVPLHS